MNRWGSENEPYPGITPAEVREKNNFQFSYAFDNQKTPTETSLLGNKGARLVEMTRLGLPVPPGFILTTEAWRAFGEKGDLPEKVWQETLEQLSLLEKKTGLKFSDPENPLIVSVRSGAPHSMPGLLKTVLNIGLNDKTVEGLANRLDDEWSTWDSYRRGIESFAEANGTNPKIFEKVLEQTRKNFGVLPDQNLPVKALKEVVERYKELVAFPQDTYEQLRLAFGSVLSSWNNPEAFEYRRKVGITDDKGMAMIIEKMVYGNREAEFSGSGIYFTRNPLTGEKDPKAAYLKKAQGVDVVGAASNHQLINVVDLPQVFHQELLQTGQKLEGYYKRPQEIEFVFDGTSLWFLQTRGAIFSPEAALRSFHDFYSEGLLSKEEIIDGFCHEFYKVIPVARLDPPEAKKAEKEGRLLGQGIPVSSGVAVGKAVTNSDQVNETAFKNTPLVLKVESLESQDLIRLSPNIMGVATDLGGGGSHIAQILKGFNLPAIFGFEGSEIKVGMEITFDANEGRVFAGEVPQVKENFFSPDLANFIKTYKDFLQKNPWLFACYKERKFSWQELRREVERIYEEIKNKWRSSKAQIDALVNAIIPVGTRMEYRVFPQGKTEAIRDALNEFLQNPEVETSVRTGHFPPKPAGAPWQRLTTLKEVTLFFENKNFPGKYGGYPHWQEDETLTEVIVGCFPTGKLDPTQGHEHFIFTLGAQPQQVLLQIIPHTAQLRDLEEVKAGNIITVRALLEPESPTGLGQITTHFGGNLENDLQAQEFTNLVVETIFNKWWRPPFALPHRLAALDLVAGLDILEGQGRIYPDGRNWCFIYGMKGEEKLPEAEA